MLISYCFHMRQPGRPRRISSPRTTPPCPLPIPLPSAALGRRHRPDPASARAGCYTQADRAGPRAGQGQHRHPQRTPALRCPDPHRSAAQGRHRAARGHRLLACRRADQRPARGEQLPELQHQRSSAAGPARRLQPAAVRWHSAAVHAGQRLWPGTDSGRLRRPHRSGQGRWLGAVRPGRGRRCDQPDSAAACTQRRPCEPVWTC